MHLLDTQAHTARNQCIRQDVLQENSGLIETVHWTYFNTVGVLALNAGFGNNKGHKRILTMVTAQVSKYNIIGLLFYFYSILYIYTVRSNNV